MKTLLIVDDEPDARFTLRQMLRKLDCEILEASDGVSALEVLGDHHVDLVISDMRMPRMDGMGLLERIVESEKDTAVLLITAYGEIEDAVRAIKAGACDYICKPVMRDEILVKVDRALQSRDVRKQVEYLTDRERSEFNYGEVVGNGPAIRRIRVLIEKVHSTDSSILIRGESGTGKEIVARAIHYRGARSDKPFIKVNPSSLAESVLESELFGHEKGAFTGAHAGKQGRFELADKGTLFLDEIGDISLAVQAKLIRFLEEKVFERVGGHHPIRTDVRIVTATNVDLESLIREGRFREDLFFRLNVIPVQLPPLRSRKEDIPLLVDHFVRAFGREMRSAVRGVREDALEKLMRHEWPGNVRELKNVIERAVTFAEHEELRAEDILISETDRLRIDIRSDEREKLVRALRESGGNQSEAARWLGMDRRTFAYRLKKHVRDG